MFSTEISIYILKKQVSVVYSKCGYEYEKYLKKNELKY